MKVEIKDKRYLDYSEILIELAKEDVGELLKEKWLVLAAPGADKFIRIDLVD